MSNNRRTHGASAAKGKRPPPKALAKSARAQNLRKKDVAGKRPVPGAAEADRSQTKKPTAALANGKSAGAEAKVKSAAAAKATGRNGAGKSPAKVVSKVGSSRANAVSPKSGIKVSKSVVAASRAAQKATPQKSRQLAASTKSGIEMKTKPAAAPAVKSVAAAPDKARISPAIIALPENYQPKDSEPFMNPMQRHYFRLKLLNWKEDILRQTRETLQGMVDDTLQHADLADRATSETDRALELRARDRQRKLISKIDAALARIEDGTYGFCEETGEPIGLKRLDARPIATLSLEAQERHERRERVHRGD